MPAAAETPAPELAYRADIDGLRAFSVGLVMAFHMAAVLAPGGFVGVDVFFVISGFLISGLILKALQAGRFSLTSFYVRRIRRIVPALFVVIALTVAAGCIVLMPGDLRETARSGLYALFGASNFYFLQNTGYFDITAEMLPFLHTWSLGVEEQFYLAWPLFLALLYRLTQGHRGLMAAAVAVVVAASFAACLWILQHSPKHAFYLPFTRAWQLGLGALLIFLPALPRTGPARAASEVLPLAGLGLIVAAALHLKQGVPYPGWDAAMPAVGAALVLYDGGGASLARRLLSLPPMVFLGKISYSLYLWHWPILVLWRHLINGDKVTGIEAAVLAALSIVAATLSWRFVETPARRGAMRPATVFTGAGVAAAALAAFTALIVRYDGLPQRVAPEAYAMRSLEAMWEWRCPRAITLPIAQFFGLGAPDPTVCGFGADWATAKQKALLWGDSNAEHFLPMLHEAGLASGTAIALVIPCPPVLNETYPGFRPDLPHYARWCGERQRSVIGYLKASPDITHVILSARWSAMPDVLRPSADAPVDQAAGLKMLEAGLRAVLAEIASPGRRIVVVNDIPLIPVMDSAACILSRIGLPRARICPHDLEAIAYWAATTSQKPSHDLLRALVPQFPNTMVLNPEDTMCADKRCRMRVNDEYIYRDTVHYRRNLAPETNREIARLIGFEKALQPVAATGKTN